MGRGEPGSRPEGVNPSGQGTEQLIAKGNEPESVAFISVKNKDIYPYIRMKGAWSVFRLLLAAKTHSCPQHRAKVAVAAGLPHKTEPSPKPLRC